MENREYDVVVIGAGPGGSISAKTIAEQGLNVLLMEKRQEIGAPKRCAEGTSINTFRRLEIPIEKRWICSEIKGFYLHAPNGKRISRVWKETQGFVLERKIFDKYLASLAVRAGSELMVKTAALGIEYKNNCLRVKASHFGEPLEIETKMVIGADGVESKVARWLGIDTSKLRDMTSNVQFEMVGVDLEDPNILYFYFGNKIAPGGYAWIFPKGNDVANVGLGVRKSNTIALNYLRRFIDSHENLKKGVPIELNVGGTPVSGPLEKTYTERALIVGDAAGQIDPLTGGGIYSSMTCGKIAGKVASEAIENNDTSEKFLSRYQEEWYKTIGKNMERSLRIKQSIEKLSDEGLNIIAEALSEKDLPKSKKEIIKTVIRHPDLLKLIREIV
ncbi:MAG: NAD(P)/FAD-dependent oxidoreductase [Candidatus Hydrothermarchaeota archaeon]